MSLPGREELGKTWICHFCKAYTSYAGLSPFPLEDLYSCQSPAPITTICGGAGASHLLLCVGWKPEWEMQRSPFALVMNDTNSCTSVPTSILEWSQLWGVMRHCFDKYTTCPVTTAVSIISSNVKILHWNITVSIQKLFIIFPNMQTGMCDFGDDACIL